MSLNPSSIGMLLLVLREEGKDKSYQIVSDMNAELTRLAPYAKMVEQMEILGNNGYWIDYQKATLNEGKCHWWVIGKDRTTLASEYDNDILIAFTAALTALLSSLPDSRLAAKLGVE